MKTLDKKDIDLVKPKFKQMVLDAWKNGEDVPYGIIWLSDAPLTPKEIQWAKKLIEKHPHFTQ